MKKYIAFILALLLLLTLLCACTKEGPGGMEKPNPGKDTSAKDDRDAEKDTDPEIPQGETYSYEEENEHVYNALNQDLKFEMPRLEEGKSFLWTDWDKRIIVTFSEPIGTDYRCMIARDVKNGYLFGDYGYLDNNKRLLVSTFSSESGFMFSYMVSPDEYYNVVIDVSLRRIKGKDQPEAEKGDWTVWKETERFSAYSGSYTALLPFENEEEGGTLCVEIVGKGDNADPVRAFGEAFRVDILHNNDDRHDLDVSYTFRGDRVDTSKCVTQYDVTASVLKSYGLTIPNKEECEDAKIALGIVHVETDDCQYYIHFDTEEDDRYMLDPLVSGTLSTGEKYCVREVIGLMFVVESNQEMFVPEGFEKQTNATTYFYVKSDSDVEDANEYAEQVMTAFKLS